MQVGPSHPGQMRCNFRLQGLMLAFCLIPCGLFAQTYFFDHYSVAQGFDSKVFCIHQDNSHYLWLGTQTGLSRFDGVNVVHYTTDDGLSQGGVRAMYGDAEGQLWLGHEGGGVTRLTGRIFERISGIDTMIRSNITSFSGDGKGGIWITTELHGALYIENPADPSGSLRFRHFLQGRSLGDQVFGSLNTSGGDLYFITNAGVRTYNASKESFESFTPPGMFTYFNTTAMFEDSKGNLWFGTYNGGLSRMDRETGRFSFYDKRNGLASDWVSALAEDSKGNLWVGHWADEINKGGVSRIDPSGNITVFNTSNGLHDNRIWCIHEDFEGNILIGTTEQGLDVFKGEHFIGFTSEDGLPGNQVYALAELEGSVWIGTNEGIAVYQAGKKIRLFNQENSFISNHIRFLVPFRNNMWIGTADQGVVMYDAGAGHFVAQPVINSYIPYQTRSTGIRALALSPDGNLWIGTLDGLVVYNVLSHAYVGTFTQESGLAGNEISALYAAPNGDLWIGSEGRGITLRRNGIFTRPDTLRNIASTCITGSAAGDIWIGTKSRGVFRLTVEGLEHYGTEKGLLSNLVNLVVCDKDNNLYAGTNRGLSKISLKENRIYNYTRRIGFTGIETKPNACCLSSSGDLWFGTSNGAILCQTRHENKSDRLPRAEITEMRVKGLKADLTPGIKLANHENDISFSFISISLLNPEGISYEVMLEGLFDSWQDQRNSTTISFNKLRPGRYVFRVRARNEFGGVSDQPASLSFRILAPFYQRGYFIIAVAVILMIAVATFIKVRERNLRLEKKVLEERVEERTQALSLANLELSVRNKDILDSINYARRIQLAILPAGIPFPETFILFRPKDIVSGDFYWLNSAGGKEFMIAVDCTGHGVPGAFMSFIGYTSLNKIIIEQAVYQPASILDRLNAEVTATLHQKDDDLVNDGMDIALISYDPVSLMVEYAGAFNPLIHVRNGRMTEIKADRFAIGRTTGVVKKFQNHTLAIEPGDSVYLYSDGYGDQFGGTDGKKFKTSTLKELLRLAGSLPASEQLALVEESFDKWKNGHEQIDDVLVMGRRF